MEPKPTFKNGQPVILSAAKSCGLSRKRRIYLNGYPDVSGFRIFYICALIFYMFLQNEPNFFFSKMTLSHFLLIPYASGVRPERVKTNPFLPLLRHTTNSPFSARNGRFQSAHPQKAPFYTHQPPKFEPIFTPPATHDVPLDSGSKSHISPKSPDKISLFLTTKTAKKSNPINARRDTRQIF
jgi:hypothetical protein